MSVSDWLLQQEKATIRILNRAKRPCEKITCEKKGAPDHRLTKIQLQLFSYCKYSSSRIIKALQLNTHIGICNGAAMEEAIWEGLSTGV